MNAQCLLKEVRIECQDELTYLIPPRAGHYKDRVKRSIRLAFDSGLLSHIGSFLRSTMAGTCLPDEILAPILHSVLHIPTAKFFKFESQTDEPRSRSLVHDDTPPFKANRAWPLQVCKQWLRVGTPLLYESLRLSQKEHTDALVALLDKASYVGAMVFNLRVDGRNGTSMDLGRVVRHMPNVENLFIYVETWSTPDTMGLREALPLLNPLRLFLDEGMSSCGIVVSNEARKAVWKAVNEHWTQLVRTKPLVARTLQRSPVVIPRSGASTLAGTLGSTTNARRHFGAHPRWSSSGRPVPPSRT